jgi:hypothetical protein
VPRSKEKKVKATDQGPRPKVPSASRQTFETSDVRETMPIYQLKEPHRVLSGTTVEGGPRPAGTSADRLMDAEEVAAVRPPGPQEVYVLRHTAGDQFKTPRWRTGDSGEQAVVAVFTSRDKAIHYLQAADWLKKYEPASLSPNELAAWLRDASAKKIDFVAVDPDRLEQQRGEAQPAISLDDLVDRSEEELYRDIDEAGRP